MHQRRKFWTCRKAEGRRGFVLVLAQACDRESTPLPLRELQIPLTRAFYAFRQSPSAE